MFFLHSIPINDIHGDATSKTFRFLFLTFEQKKVVGYFRRESQHSQGSVFIKHNMSGFNAVPRLLYFNIEGAAEKVRLAFVLAGVDFQDDRISMPAPNWSTIKASLPNGQVPVLYIGDKVITQSSAMCRWAARKGDGSLYPVLNEDLCVKIDELIGIAEDDGRDFRTCIYIGVRPQAFGYPDDFATTETGIALVKTIRENWVAEDLPRYMGHLMKALAQSGGPFLCGSDVTLADCWWLPRIKYLGAGIATHIPLDCLAPYPEVLAWKERVLAIPKIAAWYAQK